LLHACELTIEDVVPLTEAIEAGALYAGDRPGVPLIETPDASRYLAQGRAAGRVDRRRRRSGRYSPRLAVDLTTLTSTV